MSYTDFSGTPEDLHFLIANDELLISFTCPRCDNGPQIYPVDPSALIYGLEIECEHPQCRAKGERYGFQLTMFPHWSQSILGTNDRPLHKD